MHHTQLISRMLGRGDKDKEDNNWGEGEEKGGGRGQPNSILFLKFELQHIHRVRVDIHSLRWLGSPWNVIVVMMMMILTENLCVMSELCSKWPVGWMPVWVLQITSLVVNSSNRVSVMTSYWHAFRNIVKYT